MFSFLFFDRRSFVLFVVVVVVVGGGGGGPLLCVLVVYAHVCHISNMEELLACVSAAAGSDAAWKVNESDVAAMDRAALDEFLPVACQVRRVFCVSLCDGDVGT